MYARVLVLTALVAALGLLVAPAAGAETPDLADARLVAHGDGVAVLRGKGFVDVSGNGILWVRDLAGDAKIKVTGYGSKEVFPDGWIQYAGLHGTAQVTGSSVRVAIAGVDVDLTTIGHGEASLWGHGSHQVGSKTGTWMTIDRGSRALY